MMTKPKLKTKARLNLFDIASFFNGAVLDILPKVN